MPCAKRNYLYLLDSNFVTAEDGLANMGPILKSDLPSIRELHARGEEMTLQMV